MNNNTEEIEKYLQDEMNAEDRFQFESRLAIDPALQQELQIQKEIIVAVKNVGLKAEFASAIRRKTRIQLLAWALPAVLVLLAGTIYFINQADNSKNVNLVKTPTTETKLQINKPTINPPAPHLNVTEIEYEVEASKGKIIFHHTGSIIQFPPSAFVDSAGKVVQGKVKVTYREFRDPLDFMVSGIPMQYDSAGSNYEFESSGMCEIYAYKDSKAVFVNPNAKPQINLSGTNRSDLHNVYFFDSSAGSWKFVGKDIITAVKNTVSTSPIPVGQSIEQQNVLAKPLRPAMADINKQSFSIEVDPGAFEELRMYDRLKFEVLDESSYRRTDADELWDDLKLQRTIEEGVYSLTFTNTRRTVMYKVRPVLEAGDYAIALEQFRKKNTEYEEALKMRQMKEKKISDSTTEAHSRLAQVEKADEEWNDKMNVLIKARNKELKKIKAMNIEQAQKQQLISRQISQDQLLRANRDQWKSAVDADKSNEIIRTFQIKRFGIWNCDHPMLPGTIPIIPGYIDSNNVDISFASVFVVLKSFNGIMTSGGKESIRLVPGKENMIWGILDSSFYYFSYKDFAVSGINGNTRKFNFRMRKAPKLISSYDELQELVGKL